MQLSQLMKRIVDIPQEKDRDVSFVTDKIEKVESGCAFVCIDGKNNSGYIYAKDAVKNGAVCVISEKDIGLEEQIIVDNSRRAYTLMCSALCGDPADRLKMIGVTGTNGKTSSAYLLRELLEDAGKKTGLIGTVEILAGDKKYLPVMTTPEPPELFGLLKEMVECGCEYCVIEASSQGLDQQRLAGIEFEIGIFTNLTEDHLDYHSTMQEYKNAKRKLFEHSKTAVVNIDDEYGEEMTRGLPVKTVTYSIKNDNADYTAKNVELSEDSIKYEFVGMGIIGRVKLPMPGRFSVYNSMAAAAAAIELGVDMMSISGTFARSKGIRGRMETLETGKDFSVIIDYAHTPDGLENLLTSVREVYKGSIITVFGCGGDRDRMKRPIMGETVGRLSDVALVTSDNPRSEEPEKIIEDIMAGLENSKAKVYRITDRTQAIKKALSLAKEGDVVVLAGKGHETYQVLKDGKIHFDEREIVKDILDNK